MNKKNIYMKKFVILFLVNKIYAKKFDENLNNKLIFSKLHNTN